MPNQQQKVFSSVRELKSFVLQQEQSRTQRSEAAPQMAQTHQQAIAAQSRELTAVGDLLQHAVAGAPPPPPPQMKSSIDRRRSGTLLPARGTHKTCLTHAMRLAQNIAQGGAAATSGSSQPVLMHAQRPAVLTAVQGHHGQQRQGQGVHAKPQRDVRRNDDGWPQLMESIKLKWADFNAAHEARIELVRVSYRRSGKGSGGWSLLWLLIGDKVARVRSVLVKSSSSWR
jgi:hypothetical protein